MAEAQKRVVFTVKEIEAVKCPPSGKPDKSGRVYIYDAKVPGMAFCVTEGGARNYYYCYRFAGEYKRKKIGTPETFTIDQARKQAGAYSLTIERGVDPVAKEKADREEKARAVATFADLWTAYSTEYLPDNAKPRTIREYQRIYDTHLAQWHSRPLSSIEAKDCEILKVRVAEHGKYAANRTLELVSAMFRRKGKNFGLPPLFTPTTGVEHYDEEPRDRVLSDEELAQVFDALKAEPNVTARDFFTMLICTGMRKDNVRHMKWNDIHEEGEQRVWKVAGIEMKGKKAVTVALPPEAVEVIDRRAADNPMGSKFVFPVNRPTQEQVDEARRLRAEGKKTREIAEAVKLAQTTIMRIISPKYTGKGDGTFGGAAKAWTRILDRAGVAHATIHDLRRTYVTALIESGVPLPVVSTLVAHATTATTERSYMNVRRKFAAAQGLVGWAKVMENIAAAKAREAEKAKRKAG